MPTAAPKNAAKQGRQQSASGPVGPAAKASRGHAEFGPYAGILSLQRAAGNGAISESLACGTDKNLLNRSLGASPLDPASSFAAPQAVRDALRSPGRPLEAPLREYMEARVGPRSSSSGTSLAGSGLMVAAAGTAEELDAQESAEEA